LNALVESADAFAVDLYARLARAPGNLVFSPHGIHSALALAWAGARLATAAEEMATILHLPREGDVIEAREVRVPRHTPSLGSISVSAWGQ